MRNGFSWRHVTASFADDVGIARDRSPSLIIVDHVEGFCGRRYILESRTLHTFITLMDALSEGPERCVVIGLTSKPDDLDPALRRERRFEMEIETGVPTAADRLQILRRLLCDVAHALTEADMETLARTTHAYVGSDLKEVVLQGREQRWDLTRDIEAPLTSSDLNWGVKQVSPSAMREVHLEVPQVRWSDIGGQEEIKLQLRQAVEWPITRPEAFKRMGITPPAGYLLYGPPGCSKTMIAKALATESGLNFMAVKGPELFDKYVGESERAVREVFRKARSAAPSIIFIDEIDSLSVERGGSGGGNSVADRVLTQLLTEMDGIVALRGVTIVAATNRPDLIDKALLRPGRFDRLLYVPLPDADTRLQILQIIRQRTPMADDVCLHDLVSQTDRFSGAEAVWCVQCVIGGCVFCQAVFGVFSVIVKLFDVYFVIAVRVVSSVVCWCVQLTALCQEAGIQAMWENVKAREVHQRHFDAALRTVWPRTTQDTIHFYEKYTAHRAV
ncbi:hypothetical protein ACOMHN_045456 [Nucella lapillus]